MKTAILPSTGRFSFGLSLTNARAKRRSRAALAALAVAALSTTASATTYIYEPFDYTDNQDLHGKTNTYVTPNRNWLVAAPSNPTVIKTALGNLTGPAELKSPIGNSLTINGVGTNSGGTDRFAMFNDTTSNISSGTLYYSFTLRVDALTGSNNTIGGYFLALNNTGNAGQATNPTVTPARMQMRVDPTDSTKFNLGAFNNRTAAASDNNWSGSLVVGQTYFVVGATDVASATSATNARFWIDPAASSFGTATVPTADKTDTIAGTALSGGVKSLLMRQSPAPFLTLDEVRVANSWAEVTPILSAFWDINGSTAGAGGASPSGTWDGSASNWSSSSAGDVATTVWPGSAFKAIFSGGTDATGAFTVTVSGTQNATALSFEEGSATLAGGTLNISAGVIETVSTGTTTISSAITGASGLSKNGTGSVVLTGSLGYTGNTTINAGTLQIGDGGTVGALPTGSSITNGGTLVFNRSNTVTQGTDFSSSGISGTGSLTQAGAGNLILNVPNTFSGTTKATAGTLTVTDSLGLQNSTVDTSGAGAIVFDNALTSATVGGLSGATNYSANSALSITIGGNIRNASFAGVVSGSGSVTKNGSINQELSGVNTYSGGTNVNAGILQFGPTNSMPSTGAVAVNSGGVLAVHVGGGGEWTLGASGVGTVGGLINGDGGQTASQVTFNTGSSLGINTQPVGTTTNTADLTYSGVIGNFNGVSDATKSVGFMKRGYGTLTLSNASNTFRGQLQVGNEGGTLRLPVALPNAGQSMAIPTVYIGSASSATNNTTLKILTNNALPSNSLIQFGGAASGGNPVFRLHDADPTGSPPSVSYNQTIRGISGGGGLVQVGAGILTIDTPTGETYTSTSTLRTDADGAWNGGDEVTGVRGKIIKTGAGRQDLTQFNQFQIGEFILQNGTIGIGDQQAFGYSGALHSKLTLQGGKMININGGSLSLQPKFVEIAGNFTMDVNGSSNSQFTNDTVTLTAPNPTITVINSVVGGTGQLIFLSKVTDNGAGYGFTKAGPGTLNLTTSGIAGNNDYSGATTIQEGNLRVIEFSRIGNTTSPLNLSGGQLEFNGSGATNARLFNVTNPTHVTANSTIAYSSTTAGLTDVTDPNGVVFEFSSNTFDQTGGTLTLEHQGTSQGITFRPRFSGTAVNYAGPVVISNGAQARKTVMESTNATGTQTWGGNITGTGSYSRGTGGNTVFAGQLVSIGGTVSVANNSKIQLASSAGYDRVIRTPTLSIGTTNSQLDLTNNKLIVTAVGATGTWNGSAYTAVTGLIASGRNGNTWNGSGIVTSETQAAGGNLTSIGVAKASDVRPATATATDLWGGQTITGTDTLVMYTYGGDANLDGKINIDDYVKIDSGIAGGYTGWTNGDFNYDGKVSIDDYITVIDANIGNQSGVFPTGLSADGVDGVVAVPEPASAAFLIMPAMAMLLRGSSRRRERRAPAASPKAHG